jgi:anti-sigma regulatory factor (Ser/Thr protein kinase)
MLAAGTVPAVSESIELSPEPASVAVARRWSRALVVEAGAVEIVDTMVLLVSELVSNVVLHAQTPCELHVDADVHRVRVEVVDGSDVLPEAQLRTDPLAPSGRGLQLVHGLSAAHGIEPQPGGGKRVWFELSRSTTSPLP